MIIFRKSGTKVPLSDLFPRPFKRRVASIVAAKPPTLITNLIVPGLVCPDVLSSSTGLLESGAETAPRSPRAISSTESRFWAHNLLRQGFYPFDIGQRTGTVRCCRRYCIKLPANFIDRRRIEKLPSPNKMINWIKTIV